jgi:tetraacyldisaccharide 4'-kinase
MTLEGRDFLNVRQPERRVGVEHFAGVRLHALAGIGNPHRFFDSLARLGLVAEMRAYDDHHAYRSADLPSGTVLMTEKDAVKCAAFDHAEMWALRVDARVEDGLQTLILTKLKKPHGQQTA